MKIGEGNSIDKYTKDLSSYIVASIFEAKKRIKSYYTVNTMVAFSERKNHSSLGKPKLFQTAKSKINYLIFKIILQCSSIPLQS